MRAMELFDTPISSEVKPAARAGQDTSTLERALRAMGRKDMPEALRLFEAALRENHSLFSPKVALGRVFRSEHYSTLSTGEPV